MRRIVERDGDKYKVTDIVEMETVTGEKVEVVKGITYVEENKVKEVLETNYKEIAKIKLLLEQENLDKQINEYKENVEGNIEMIEDHNKILEEILQGINKIV